MVLGFPKSIKKKKNKPDEIRMHYPNILSNNKYQSVPIASGEPYKAPETEKYKVDTGYKSAYIE